MTTCECGALDRVGVSCAAWCPGRAVSGEIDSVEVPSCASDSAPRRAPAGTANTSAGVAAGLRELRDAPFTRSPTYGVLLEWDMSDLGGEA